jgi:hypothetical protein
MILNCPHKHEESLGTKEVEGELFEFLRCLQCRTIRREEV